MTPLYIFDLDGTLALIDHRRHLVEKRMCRTCGGLRITHPPAPACSACNGTGYAAPDWRAFFAACVHDEPNWPVIDTLNALRRAGAEVWIWSGRSSEVLTETRQWLHAHVFGGDDFFLVMRQEGVYIPDEQLKGDWLRSMLPANRRRLVAIFDDRDKVVSMWRAEGVPCFQVAQGAF